MRTFRITVMADTKARLRGQRISRQELIEESREVLEDKGVANNIRAKFITEIAKVVTGSDEPLYAQLQPKIIQHDSEAWIKAFILVFQYLKDYELPVTVSAMECEFGQGPLPKEIFENQETDINKEFNELLACFPRKTPFKTRVQEFLQPKAKRNQRQAKRKASRKGGNSSISGETQEDISATKPETTTQRRVPRSSYREGDQPILRSFDPSDEEFGLSRTGPSDHGSRRNRGKQAPGTYGDQSSKASARDTRQASRGKPVPGKGRDAFSPRDERPHLSGLGDPEGYAQRTTKPPTKASRNVSPRSPREFVQDSEEDGQDDFIIDRVVLGKAH